MRVALVLSSLGVGGTEKVATALANHWAEIGFRICIMTLSGPDDVPFFSVHSKVSLTRLDVLYKPRSIFEAVLVNLRRALLLRRALSNFRPDVVVAFGDRVCILTLVSAWRIAPIIVTERSNPIARDPGRVWRNLRPIFYKQAAVLVAQTSGAAKQLQRYCPRTIVIANPVFLCRTNPPDNSTKVIIATGRLIESKAFDQVLRAFASIAGRHAGWSLWIYGDGPERQALESLASHLAISDRVYFKGLARGPEEWTATGQIFLFASRYEGFPNVLLEAMVAGMAVIATDCPWGPRELIENGVNGYLVPVDDPKALEKRLDALLYDARLRARLSHGALKIFDGYSPDQIFNRWDELLDTCVRGPK